MATEIELKYLVFSENTAEKITSILSKEKIEFIESCHQLTNCYFDTPDLNLRHHDMGLRIREKAGVFEQTIKTAGKIIGGLHQRPEFNVPISSKKTNLSLFPGEIWEPSQNVSELQKQLVSLFSTDFERRTWLINTHKGGVVEVVFDQGEVASKGVSDPICEIELELVRGDISELFSLAKLFFSHLTLRPGSKSKAARGYALWNGTQQTKQNKLVVGSIPVEQTDKLADSFIKGITFLLGHLQKGIDQYVDQPSNIRLAFVKEVLTIMQHGFSMYKPFLTEELNILSDEVNYFVDELDWVDNAIYLRETIDKTGNYRGKLDYSSALIEQLKLEKRRFPDAENVTNIFKTERFNLLQLSLLEMLMPNATVFVTDINHPELKSFATLVLNKSLNELIAVMPEASSLSSEKYLEQSSLLNASLHTGIWLGSLFDEYERTKYRAPWLDIREGISELQVLWIIQQQLQMLPEQPKKLVNWQNSKVDNLLHALDHSRSSALSTVPYWV